MDHQENLDLMEISNLIYRYDYESRELHIGAGIRVTTPADRPFTASFSLDQVSPVCPVYITAAFGIPASAGVASLRPSY